MNKKRGFIASLIVILILASTLTGCSGAQANISTPSAASSGTKQATASQAASASTAASAAPAASSSEPAAVLKKDQLKSLEQPLTGLLLTVEETSKDYPGKDAAVDPQFAEYYLYYMANNFYDQNIKTYPDFKDPTFTQFIAFSSGDADKILNAAFGKRFASGKLPAFDPKSQGNVAFMEKGTVYVGANLGGPSSVTYEGGDVTLQNGSADVQYKYDYVPMTHGLEYNGALTATVTQDEAGMPVITGLNIPPLEDSSASAGS